MSAGSLTKVVAAILLHEILFHPSSGVRYYESVCLSVCLSVFLSVWSSSGSVTVCFELAVFWMMSCFSIMGPMVQATQVGCKLKVTHQGAAPYRVWSLMSTVAFFIS